MHELDGVSSGQAPARLHEDLHDLAPCPRLVLEPGREIAGDELHRHEELLVHRAHVEHRDDVGVREPRHGLRLALQAGPCLGRRRATTKLGPDELEGHAPIELRIVGGKDHAHSARSELVEHQVTAQLASPRDRHGKQLAATSRRKPRSRGRGVPWRRYCGGGCVMIVVPGVAIQAKPSSSTDES